MKTSHQKYFLSPTECELLPGVRGESEAEQGHAGDEDAGHDQVEEIVESSPPDVDGEGDVHVGLRAAVVRHAVLLPGNSWIQSRFQLNLINCCHWEIKERKTTNWHLIDRLTD